MNLPDRIFAVGGAGKAITLQLLDADWVLESVLKPRPSPRSVDVTIIDTAQGEENEDRERIQEIRRRINEKENELRDPQEGRTGSIDVEYKLVTNDIQLGGQIDLLGDDVVPRIAAGNGMDEENWWLREGHINENLDFAKGVVRKRGLGKAIYYKAYAEDDQLSSVIDLPDKGKVAVVTGLGGGTGSGVFLDLVEHLQQKQRTAEITLFGILPNHTEGIEENTNAFAALSELEYLSLQGENLFKDRVLLPIDPTGFDGKTGNRIQTGQFLEELDEAAIYMLASYYNTQNLEDPFAGSPSYAPFTIGVPQVLRYNVEAINDARESLREILGHLEDSLHAEREIYSQVDRFLSRHYQEETMGGGGLRDMDRADLEERLDAVEDLTEFDLFTELDYQSVDIFHSILQDARGEGEGVGDQIDIAAGSLRAGSHQLGGTDESFVDDIDELLADLLERSIELLALRKDLLERKKAVEDNQVRNTVEHLLVLGSDSINAGVQLNRLEGKLEDVRDRRQRLESDLEETTAKLEQLREDQADEVRRQKEEFERAIDDDFRQYERMVSLDVASRVATLEGELEAFRNDVVSADDAEAVDGVSAAGVNEALNALESDLQEVGVSFEEQRQAVQGSLPALRRAKAAYLRMNREEGALDKLKPWTSSVEEERKEAQKDYQMQKNQLQDKGVFTVGPAGTSFTADIEFDPSGIERQVERRTDELRGDIVAELRSRLETADEGYVHDLEAALERNPDHGRVLDIAEDALHAEAGDAGDVEQRKVELESDLADAEALVEVYESTTDLFEQLNNHRSTFVQERSEFEKRRTSYGEESSRPLSTEEAEYVYVKNITPNDVLRTAGDSGIAESDLFKSREETQRLRDNLDELARNARKQQYTGLKRRKFSKGRQRYDDLKVRVAALSPVVDQLEPDVLDLEDVFSGSFDLGGSGNRADSRYTSWQRDIGDSWDIGLTVFIDGVFLDNIRKVADADGYASGYDQQHRALGDDILVHHAYGLDQGFYVRRRNVLNLENEEDVGFFLEDEGTVVDGLLEDHVEVVDLHDEDEPEPEGEAQRSTQDADGDV
jgi:hypothetical protein